MFNYVNDEKLEWLDVNKADLKNSKTQTQNISGIIEKPVSKWSENTLYHEVKRKIYQKIKTETSVDFFAGKSSKNKLVLNHKPKSKLIVSTLQIVLDPRHKKIKQESFEYQKRIHNKVDTTPVQTDSQFHKIERNMSAKLLRQHTTLSFHKNQEVKTCRKNSKIYTQVNTQSTKKTQEQPKPQQLQSSKIFQSPNLEKIGKCRSQYLKQQSKTPLLKTQDIDSQPLLFYFKAKNSTKNAEREMSIKKIRIKSKNRVFA